MPGSLCARYKPQLPHAIAITCQCQVVPLSQLHQGIKNLWRAGLPVDRAAPHVRLRPTLPRWDLQIKVTCMQSCTAMRRRAPGAGCNCKCGVGRWSAKVQVSSGAVGCVGDSLAGRLAEPAAAAAMQG